MPYYINDINQNVIEEIINESKDVSLKGINKKISGLDILQAIYDGSKLKQETTDKVGWEGVKDTAIYAKIKDSILGDYGDIIGSSTEADRIIYQYIMNRIKY